MIALAATVLALVVIARWRASVAEDANDVRKRKLLDRMNR